VRSTTKQGTITEARCEACETVTKFTRGVKTSVSMGSSKNAAPYDRTRTYRKGQVMTHDKFGRGEVTGVDISPSAGISVKDIKRGDIREGSLFWDVTIDVAGDAVPGNRTIVAVNQNGRTAPRPITVYAKVPTISNPKIVSAAVNQPTLQLQFGMTETPNEIGDAPYVWFYLGCGGEPESGVVKGKYANGVVTAAIPNPRTQLKPFAPPPTDRCDLEFRASDAKMADSNTLTTTVDFK